MHTIRAILLGRGCGKHSLPRVSELNFLHPPLEKNANKYPLFLRSLTNLSHFLSLRLPFFHKFLVRSVLFSLGRPLLIYDSRPSYSLSATTNAAGVRPRHIFLPTRREHPVNSHLHAVMRFRNVQHG